jgi:HSP20 family protein
MASAIRTERRSTMLTRPNLFEGRNGALAVGPLFRDFDSLFRDLAAPLVAEAEGRPLLPPADVLETEAGLKLQLDLPGHDPKEIQVKVENNVLTIQSERKLVHDVKEGGAVRTERRSGVYVRSFTLPASIDASRVEASYEHGVLTLNLPKREEAKPRVIEVKVQGS